jgi:hypothetical protein
VRWQRCRRSGDLRNAVVRGDTHPGARRLACSARNLWRQRCIPRRPDVEPAGKRLEVDCFTSVSPSCRPLASVGHLYARSLLTSLAPDGLQSLAQSGRRRTSSAGCLIQYKALLGAAGQARRAGESLGRRSPRYSQSSRGGGCFGDAQVRRPASHCRRYGGERGGLQKIWPPTSRPSSP